MEEGEARFRAIGRQPSGHCSRGAETVLFFVSRDTIEKTGNRESEEPLVGCDKRK